MEKMNYIIFGKQKDIAFIQSEGSMIKDTQSALGLMMSARYEMGCNKLILNKSCFAGEFFMLSSGLCGEILQKFVNDQMKAAIAGDFTKYTSKPLRDFIYQSNKGRDIFFASSIEEAVCKLVKK